MRGGDDNREILTEYTGTIPSSAVEALIPTAEGDFEHAKEMVVETICGGLEPRPQAGDGAARDGD